MKSKCLVFHKGRLPNCDFYYQNVKLEIVNSFVFLGFKFTVQLSFSYHVKDLITKAKSRIGFLFSKLPLYNLPIHIVLAVFDCYITSIFKYGLHLWISSVSNSVLNSLDSLFTRFLKRYLRIPFFTNNSITYFLTNTVPFSNRLLKLVNNVSFSAVFTRKFDGTRLDFLNNIPTFSAYNPIPLIPSDFWHSPVVALDRLPLHPSSRRAFLLSVLGRFAIIPPRH